MRLFLLVKEATPPTFHRAKAWVANPAVRVVMRVYLQRKREECPSYLNGNLQRREVK